MDKELFLSKKDANNLQANKQNEYVSQTRSAILWTSILNEPFSSLYPLMLFVLDKGLGASAFQIIIFTMLKPVVALFSFYWSAHLDHRKKTLRSNLIGAGILARLPFLFYPFVDNIWFFILSAPLYMLFSRAGIPAWMEILKRNLPKSQREKFFSLGSAVGYAEGVFIAVGFGLLLDSFTESWKLLFFASALLGLVGVYLQSRLPIHGDDESPNTQASEQTVKDQLKKPWKDSLDLMRTRPDFAHFQWGFMACGFAVMLIQPVLPRFVDNVLNLSYTELAIAISICKGLGFAFSSSFWAKGLDRFSLAILSSLVFICTGLFPLFLLTAPVGIAWLYLAYIFYGVAQAGSHLIWHMSGPLFAETEDSSRFSGVNVVMVGIRGVVGPLLGGVLAAFFGPIAVLALSVVFSFYAGWYMRVFKPEAIKNRPLA